MKRKDFVIVARTKIKHKRIIKHVVDISVAFVLKIALHLCLKGCEVVLCGISINYNSTKIKKILTLLT